MKFYGLDVVHVVNIYPEPPFCLMSHLSKFTLKCEHFDHDLVAAF